MQFFFFKQNTPYEMRISDWSSDVCSSDLHRAPRLAPFEAGVDENAIEPFLLGLALDQSRSGHDQRAHPIGHVPAVGDRRSRAQLLDPAVGATADERSEERRVGKEWFSTCRSRWSPDP